MLCFEICSRYFWNNSKACLHLWLFFQTDLLISFVGRSWAWFVPARTTCETLLLVMNVGWQQCDRSLLHSAPSLKIYSGPQADFPFKQAANTTDVRPCAIPFTLPMATIHIKTAFLIKCFIGSRVFNYGY